MKIILKIDGSEDINQEILIQDISQLRDILATIVREYHIKGDDRVDDLRRENTELRNMYHTLAKSFEDVKNQLHTVELDNIRYSKGFTDVLGSVEKYHSFGNKKFETITNTLNDLKNEVNILKNTLKGSDNIDLETIGGLSVRMANLIKKVSELDERLSKKSKFWL